MSKETNQDHGVPEMLYKYRDLSIRTLSMLVCDELYFADSGTFNDPLDTRPGLDSDVDDTELERIVRTLVERREQSHLEAAAKTMGLRGSRATEYIERHSHRRAEKHIEHINYYATEPDYDTEEHRRFLLNKSIESELLGRYENGIVSFTERANCPLMWSHYGDQHRGICVGYSVPPDAVDDVHKVEYGGSRLVQASKVAAMLDGSGDARTQVDEAVLLRKAESWGYEQEWRLVGRRGSHGSPLEMEEVVFGLKCDAIAEYIVMKVLHKRATEVRFFKIRETPGTFELTKHALEDAEELFATFPRRHLSVLEAFEPAPSISSSKTE